MRLENLTFRDCIFNIAFGSESIIEGSGECSEGQNGTLTLSSVLFANNRLVGAVALRIPTTSSCMSIKMINVAFENNTCRGNICGALLSTDNELEECTFEGNHLDDNAADDHPFMLSVPTGSTTLARDITAEKNAVGLLNIRNGSLTLKESTFAENRPGEDRSFGPLVYLIDAKAEFESCRFEENGDLSAGSLMIAERSDDVTLTDCHFVKNSAESGGVLYLNMSSVVIDRECWFASNEASIYGGVVYAFASKISVSNTDFDENKAQVSGGCFYLESDSELNVSSDSRMTKNAARRGGVAALLDGSTANLADAVFAESNGSASNGGAFLVHRSRLAAQNCQFNGSLAARGGFVYAEDAVLELTASNFSGGNASLGGAFALEDGTTLNMRDVRMEDNEATQEGGAIYMIGGSNATVDHSQCISNKVKREGGGGCFFTESSSLTLLDSVIAENEAPKADGGAVSCRENSILSVNASEFSGNKAASGGTISLSSGSSADIEFAYISDSQAGDSGGALFMDTASVDLSHCNISVSGAEQRGGLLCALNSTVSLSHSQLKNGSALDGGCLHLSGGTVASIQDTSLTGCDAQGNGGALSIADASECSISGESILEQNTANATGGAVYATGGILTIQDTHIAGNAAREGGGGIYASQSLQLELIHANLTGNRAKDGGALAIVSSSAATVTDCQFSQNSASDGGGGCYLNNTHVRFEGCRFQDNRGRRGGAFGVWRYSEVNLTDCVCRDSYAEEDGGCLFGSHNSGMSIRNGHLENCTAERNGGGIHLERSTDLSIAESSFMANRAEKDGGAISARTSEIEGNNLVFTTNTAGQRGGSVRCTDDCEMDIAETVFEGNSAGDGGVGCLTNGSSVAIRNCQLGENEARRSGGGFSVNWATLHASDSQFDRGLAGTNGGFVEANNGSRIIIQNVRMTRGEANNGGAMFIDDSELDAAGCRIERCSARFDGGAMHMYNARTSNCTRCQLTKNSAERGGAVAFESTELSTVEWCFSQSALRNNKASYGGMSHMRLMLGYEEDLLRRCDSSSGTPKRRKVKCGRSRPSTPWLGPHRTVTQCGGGGWQQHPCLRFLGRAFYLR